MTYLKIIAYKNTAYKCTMCSLASVKPNILLGRSRANRPIIDKSSPKAAPVKTGDILNVIDRYWKIANSIGIITAISS